VQHTPVHCISFLNKVHRVCGKPEGHYVHVSEKQKIYRNNLINIKILGLKVRLFKYLPKGHHVLELIVIARLFSIKKSLRNLRLKNLSNFAIIAFFNIFTMEIAMQKKIALFFVSLIITVSFFVINIDTFLDVSAQECSFPINIDNIKIRYVNNRTKTDKYITPHNIIIRERAWVQYNNNENMSYGFAYKAPTLEIAFKFKDVNIKKFGSAALGTDENNLFGENYVGSHYYADYDQLFTGEYLILWVNLNNLPCSFTSKLYIKVGD